MNTLLETNIGKAEKIRRYVIGAVLIAAVMFNPSFPVWVALVACYPIFTAMLETDPLTGIIHRLIQVLRKQQHHFSSSDGNTASI